MPQTFSLPYMPEQAPNSGRFPLDLLKTPKALRFGCDALLLSAHACKILEQRFHSDKKDPSFVELGCADGMALLGLLSKFNQAKALGLDINSDFISLARQNAARLSLSASFLTLDMRQCALEPSLEPWRESANLVLANPPWRLPSEGRRSTNEARNLALWAEPDSLATFIKAASFFLRHGGHFCAIIHPSCLPRLMKEMEKNRLGLREILPVSPRWGQKAIRLLLRAQKDAQALPVFLSPLVLHKAGSSAWSEEALAFCPWLGRFEEGKKTEKLENI